MLEDLTIKNFALIDSVSLEFGKGFTVLSGETGAGKSILIGALSFVLGGKAELKMIRPSASEAQVSATFLLDDKIKNVEEGEASSAKEWLLQNSIEHDDNRILIRRVLRENGKSSAWIGGVPVTRQTLQEFASFLVDIHGQHEHQSLMKVSEHRKFLDERAGITDEVQQFTRLYAQLVEKRKLYEQITSSSEERLKKIELYTFAIKELEDAKLQNDEDTKLSEEEARLSSFEKLYAEIESLDTLLSEGENSITNLLKHARKTSSNASDMDSSLASLSERIENSFYELTDIANEFSSYKNHLVFDPERLKEVQERLSLIYDLKKKYLASPSLPLSDLQKFEKETRENLERLEMSDGNSEALEKEIEALEKKVYIEAKSLSEKRRLCASKMENEVMSILSELGMKGTRFAVQIAEKDGTKLEQKCGPYGMDNIEFLISANPGSPLLPLANVASGGELSRVMLTLKTIFAQSDPVQTLVFDEIDTGVGGEVAVSIGKHLQNLAKNKQILCITHLASIAVCADNQMKIEKASSSESTFTKCYEVKNEERVKEISRMLSGETSEASLEHARMLLQKSYKKR